MHHRPFLKQKKNKETLLKKEIFVYYFCFDESRCDAEDIFLFMLDGYSLRGCEWRRRRRKFDNFFFFSSFVEFVE